MSDLTDPLNTALAGRYAIQRELGRGGMATVFLAEDLQHHRLVAIKVLDPELAAVLGTQRFLREIEIAARLQHPHILTLLDSGVAAGLVYYVMPYVQGESLRERMTRERQLPVEEALKLTVEVARALDFAHRQGFVHRDIKPENILLSDGQAMVADFGIARAIRAAGGTQQTETGTTLGTPTYMSPEQVLGSEELDGRSDLYSLGCMLYEMLAGQPPFTGPSAESVIHQHLSVDPPHVTALRPSVPEPIKRALTKALAKTPADRFTSASHFVDALSFPGAAPTPSEPPARRDPVRRRAPILAVAVGLILVFAALGVAGWRGIGPLSEIFGGQAALDPGKKDLILVAEFDGPADNPDLAAAAHDLLSTALDQSRIFATVPTDELKTALQQAGKPDTSRIDAALAREIAYRRAIRAVVEGRISRLGKGYAIAVRVVDVDSSKTILSLSEVAANDGALIPTLSRLGQKLRAGLGERRSAIATDRPLVVALTPSFDAYRKFVKASELLASNMDHRGGIALLREALALDPDFAMAWKGIGVCFANLGETDSAHAAFGEALRRPDRLTDYSRLHIKAMVAQRSEDWPSAMSVYSEMLQQNLTPSQAGTTYNNRGNVLWFAGREEEALESYRRGVELTPFRPHQVRVMNLAHALFCLGHFDETRQMLGKINDSAVRNSFEINMATSMNDWATAESLGAAIQDDKTRVLMLRNCAAVAAASAEVVRGEVTAATARLRRAESASRGDKDYSGVVPWWEDLMLATFAGRALPPRYRSGIQDTLLFLLANEGIWAASSGDTNHSRRLLKTIRARPRHGPDMLAAIALIEAGIAGQASRWNEVVRILGAMAGPDNRRGSMDMESGRVMMRWLVADAREALGQPDSAAVVLELVLKPRTDEGAFEQGISHPFAHRRLVLLYASMGRVAEARRHWEILSKSCTRPDPDMFLALEEARAALVSAEGMGRAARR